MSEVKETRDTPFMPHPQAIWLGIVLVAVLFFADAPFLTFGQDYLAQRSKARLIIGSFELDLIVLWAIARFLLHAERGLAPRGAETPVAVVGLVLTLAGAALSVWAKLKLGRWFSANFAIKQGHRLVTDGPYALTRHPMYTGLLMALVGTALVWNSLLTLVLAALMVVPFFLHTVYEETLFEAHFGDDYLRYERRVPRLVPFLSPRDARAS